MQNPRTKQWTDTFQIWIYEYDLRYPVYYSNTSLTVKMNQTNSIKSIDISRGNVVNGLQSDYNFKISLRTPIQNNDFMILSVPTDDVKINNNSTCFSIQNSFINCSQVNSTSYKSYFKKNSLRLLSSPVKR